jgi:hypothetical protein
MPITREVEARAIQQNHTQFSRRRGYTVGVGTSATTFEEVSRS